MRRIKRLVNIFFSTVRQLIGSAEKAYFGKLAHPGHEDELQGNVLPFEDGVEIFQSFSHLFGHFRVLDVVKDRFVVLIHQHNSPLTIFLSSQTNQFPKGAGDTEAPG